MALCPEPVLIGTFRYIKSLKRHSAPFVPEPYSSRFRVHDMALDTWRIEWEPCRSHVVPRSVIWDPEHLGMKLRVVINVWVARVHSREPPILTSSAVNLVLKCSKIPSSVSSFRINIMAS